MNRVLGSNRVIGSILAGIFAGCLPSTSANAQGVFNITESGLFTDQATIGNSFSVSNDISVTHLGWFDVNGDGLLKEHPIKIWDLNSEAELLSGTIPAGLGTVLDDGFRYVALTAPLLLNPGEYVIGGTAESLSDPFLANVFSTISTSSISFLEPRVNITNPLAFPADRIPTHTYGYFGPNFKADEVPLPPAVWLFGSGLLGIAGIARIKRDA